MYHPGKVLAVFKQGEKDVLSADDTTQATLEMWDENILTCIAEKKIAKQLKEGDIVLVDYSPFSEKVPVAKQVITKIVYKKKADKLWKEYKDYYSKKKLEATRQMGKHYMG